jgi:hypothetical protein
MRVFRIAAVFALLTGPAYAQMATPNVNLIPELQSKTPEEKAAEEERDKAYRESLKKIPWGNVSSTDAPKTAAPVKPKTKTGSSQAKSETR